MFWNLAISKNRQALANLVAGLFLLAGWQKGTPQPEVLAPLTLRRLRTLLPKLEAALRRLIVLYVKTRHITPKAAASPPFPLPDFAQFDRHASGRAGAFNLFDPRKPLRFVTEEEASGAQPLDVHQTELDPSVESLETSGLVSCQTTLKRLAALDHALRTLPRQARRLVREMEKRKSAPSGLASVGPIRPGIPPGLCRQSTDDADHVLRECHGLVRDLALSPP